MDNKYFYVLVSIFMFLTFNAHASSPNRPLLVVDVQNALGNSVIKLPPASSQTPVTFSATASLDIGESTGYDIYFGLHSISNNQMFSWTESNKQYKLNEGLIPIKTNVSITDNQLTFGPVEYFLNGSEPSGMYFVYLLLVDTNKSPYDIENLGWIETSVFFITNN